MPPHQSTTENLYKILGIKSKATPDEIKKGYREKCMKWHPDKAGNTPENNARFAKIKEAYDILSDDEARKGYDAYRARNDTGSDHKHASSSKSNRDSNRENSGNQSSERHHTRESSTKFNSDRWKNDDWEYVRSWYSDDPPTDQSSQGASGDKSRKETSLRRGTMRMALGKLMGIGSDIQEDVEHLLRNHRRLWADFVAYGLDRGPDADLWYDLFDDTKDANRKIQDVWAVAISQTEDMWARKMQPGSEDLL